MIKIYDDYYLIDSSFGEDYSKMHLKIQDYDIVFEKTKYTNIWDKNHYDYYNNITIYKIIDSVKTKISFSTSTADTIFQYFSMLYSLCIPLSYVLPVSSDYKSVTIEGYCVDDDIYQIDIIEEANTITKHHDIVFTFEMFDDFIHKFFYFYLNEYYV